MFDRSLFSLSFLWSECGSDFNAAEWPGKREFGGKLHAWKMHGCHTVWLGLQFDNEMHGKFAPIFDQAHVLG